MTKSVLQLRLWILISEPQDAPPGNPPILIHEGVSSGASSTIPNIAIGVPRPERRTSGNTCNFLGPCAGPGSSSSRPPPACRIPDASLAKFQFPCLVRSPVWCTVCPHPCGHPPFSVRRCYFWTLLMLNAKHGPSVHAWCSICPYLLIGLAEGCTRDAPRR